MARNIHSYYNHHNHHKDDDNDDDDDCDKADDWVIGLPRLHSSSSLAPSTLHSHCHHHSSHHCHHHHHNYHHHEYLLRKIIFYIMCCILISTMRSFQVGPTVLPRIQKARSQSIHPKVLLEVSALLLCVCCPRPK